MAAIGMVAREKTKPFLELDRGNALILGKDAILDSLDIGEDIITKMIEDGLDALGENVGKVILHHIEVKYSLKRHQIPRNLKIFTRALREMFGEGSPMIERIVVETIKRRTGISANEMDAGTLPQVVEYLRIRRPHIADPTRTRSNSAF